VASDASTAADTIGVAREQLALWVVRAMLGLTTFATAQVLIVGDTPMAAFVPGVAALLLLGPALRGSTSRGTRLWLVALWHGLSLASLWVVGPSLSGLVVLAVATVTYLLVDWTDRVALSASVATSALVCVVILSSGWLPEAIRPAPHGLAGPGMASTALVICFVVVNASTAWLASSMWRAALNAEARAAGLARANVHQARFLATMSHELRTPASAILGFADLLGTQDLDEDRRVAHATVVSRNGRHLLALLDDLLDLTKVEAGELQIDPADTEVEAVIDDVVTAVRARPADGPQPTIRVAVQGAVPAVVHTDARRVRQILLNLLTNAMKFAARDVTLAVEMQGPLLALCVDDDGPGVPPHEVPHLFEAFWQGEAGKAVKKGTGLGLMLSERIARALGGTLQYVERSGPGARFVLTIPAPPPTHGGLRQGPRRHSAASLPASPVVPLGHWAEGLSVLVVDDNPDLRLLLGHELQRRGADVVEAGDGIEAIGLAKSRPLDLILMDVDMPRMDGLAATRALRDDGVTLPVVALTAFAMRGDRERCLDAGCNDYLGKPVDVPALMDLISQLTQRERVFPTPEPAPRADPLAQLRAHFLSGLPAQLAQLESHHAQGDLAALEHGAHRLAGSAGSFGFPDVSVAARALEEALRIGQEGPAIDELVAGVRGSAPPLPEG